MSATLVAEPLKDVSLVEEQGQYVSGKRSIVLAVTEAESNEEVLTSALDSEDVPQPNASYSANFPRLVVTKRNPSVIGVARGAVFVRVDIEYSLEPSTNLAYPLRGSSSVSQIETNKNREGSTVYITYDGKQYVGEFNVFAAESTQHRECIESTNDFEAVKRAWINKVNQNTWEGAASGYWLVSNVTYELWNAATNPDRWRFEYELSLTSNPDGWRYYDIYKDSAGRIPEDADFVECVWHDVADFSSKFPEGSGL